MWNHIIAAAELQLLFFILVGERSVSWICLIFFVLFGVLLVNCGCTVLNIFLMQSNNYALPGLFAFFKDPNSKPFLSHRDEAVT